MTRVKGIAGVAPVAFSLVAYAPEATARVKGIGRCQTITASGSTPFLTGWRFLLICWYE